MFRKIQRMLEADTGAEVNLQPLHPYWRSTTRAYFDNMEVLKRRAREERLI